MQRKLRVRVPAPFHDRTPSSHQWALNCLEPDHAQLRFIRQSRKSSEGDIASEFHPCWPTYYRSIEALRYRVGRCRITGESAEEQDEVVNRAHHASCCVVLPSTGPAEE